MAARNAGPVYQGQRVAIECEFRLAGVLTDPLVIQCVIRPPSGGEETLTYPNANLVRTGEGRYEALAVLDTGGLWWFRFTGSGVVEAVSEISVDVEASHVVAA